MKAVAALDGALMVAEERKRLGQNPLRDLSNSRRERYFALIVRHVFLGAAKYRAMKPGARSARSADS
jgi:hypothetical protein